MKTIHQTIFLFICFFAKAQSNPESISFLKEFYANQNTENVVFANKINSHTLEEIKKRLKNASTVMPLSKKDTIIFTKAELDYLVKQFEENYEKGNANLFQSSKQIARTEIDDIFEDKNKGWLYFDQKYGNRLLSYTEPVFLRENTICFFYSESSCGNLCGSGTLGIYIKVNNKWQFFTSLIQWIS